MKQILIIEDVADVAQMFARFLESKGYGCAVAGGGQEGIQLFEAGDFDLVLADLMMPGVSGLEVAERIRKRNRLVPMVLVTGQGDDVLVGPSAKHAGFNDVVFKPVVPDELLAKIRGLLGEAESNGTH